MIQLIFVYTRFAANRLATATPRMPPTRMHRVSTSIVFHVTIVTSPFHFVCPVGGRHFAFANVAGMSGFE